MSDEGAERAVLAVVSDLLIEVRIEAAAQLQGLNVKTASAEEAPMLIKATKPALIAVDLAVARDVLSELEIAAREAGASVAAFYPHVDTGLRKAAQDAGFEHIYPRSRFLRELPRIIATRLSD